MKITLFISGLKGLYTLRILIKTFGSGVFDKVIYATDKQICNDYSQEILLLCKSESIPIFHRQETFSIETEYSIAISWRWLINVGEQKKIIVYHDSLLPKYRGFAPLVNALINGDEKIGVTALYAGEKYDRGDIITQKGITVTYPIKIQYAIELLSKLYGELCVDLVNSIILSHPIFSTPQNDTEATYSLWRNEDDYNIDWNQDAAYIKRFIDSVGFPYRGASTYFNEVKIRILDATCLEDVRITNRDAGKAIFFEKGLPIIVCGSGLLLINAAVYDQSYKSLFPINKFRIKFTSP